MRPLHTKIAEIDVSEYPIVRVTPKIDSPSVEDAKLFVDKLLNTIKSKKDPFVIVLDASNAKWANKEIRSIIGLGFQYIEQEHKERYLKIFKCFPSWKLRILHFLIMNFVKSGVQEQLFSSIDATNTAAQEFITKNKFITAHSQTT